MTVKEKWLQEACWFLKVPTNEEETDRTDEELFVTYTSPFADLEKLKAAGLGYIAMQVGQLQDRWHTDLDRDCFQVAAAILRHVDYLLAK